MNDFLMLINENCLILVPVLNIIGYLLKSTPNIPNWTIPYFLCILGILGCCLVVHGFTLNGILQGILVSGASVLFYDSWHGIKKSN